MIYARSSATVVPGYDEYLAAEVACFLNIELIATLEGTEPLAEEPDDRVLPF
jgi:hypothetical protein